MAGARPQRAESSGRRLRWPRSWWMWALLLAVLTAAACLHVRARLAVVQLGYKLSEASTENRRLLVERRKLQVEMATLRSPQRLRKLAHEKLGLVEPRPEQILRLAPGGDKREWACARGSR
ncbi:MAG: cell division protein FtsL [Deltaproteobacteria bacterium]|nr:cell division protein FtsL [Deltaproteobacteria bacterium]